jgi:hypothetical protein
MRHVNLGKVLPLLALAALLASCAGSAKVAGIDKPIVMGDYEIQFTSATRQESYTSAGQTLKASGGANELLIVEASVVAGEPDMDTVQAWHAAVVDENGRKENAGMTSVGIIEGESSILWVFAVARDADSLTLELAGDASVPLDSLLAQE